MGASSPLCKCNFPVVHLQQFRDIQEIRSVTVQINYTVTAILLRSTRDWIFSQVMADWWLKDNLTGSLAPMHATPLHNLTPTAVPSPMDGDPRHRHPSGASGTEEEPQSRLRANTWPLNPNLQDDDQEEQASPALPPLPEEDGSGTSESVENVCQMVPGEGATSGRSGGKKNSARRNPWGNMSYADLIEKSIDSAPDKRLTLSQIYDWLVQNIPYFKEKADANSAAGWKNSVRHNLSLHNRFMRVQNETGTGKSSWWIVNQSAKFDKPSRRRAATMEPKEYDKRKPGRLKKGMLKEDYERNGSPILHSAGGSTGDLSPYAHLSLTDFRSRADSAASSYSCLSPRSPTPLDEHPSPTISPHAWPSPQPPTNPATGFNYESDFSNHLAKTMRLSDANNRSISTTANGIPVSTYQSFAPAFNLTDTNRPGFFHTIQRSFPPIPEEPRLSFFNGTHDSHNAYHSPQHTITSANHASGGNFSTLNHYPYQWSTLPHDLESITAEPVHSFDFDWEELLQQEAAIERMQHATHGPVHTIVQPPHHNTGHRL